MNDKKQSHYEAEAEREAFEDALDAVRRAGKLAETPEQFRALYNALCDASGFEWAWAPAFAPSRPGEWVATVQLAVVRRGAR